MRPIAGHTAVVILLMIGQPTQHLAITSWLRESRDPLDPSWREITDLPRARGALFTTTDAALIAGARRYVDQSLLPNETFFDFTDRGPLYFRLDRDSPIRQVIVPFYQSEALQRQVIARLDGNPNVRAALVPKGDYGVDGIPNRVRAPLVWQYLQTHFKPEFEEGDIVFWRR